MRDMSLKITIGVYNIKEQNQSDKKLMEVYIW